MSAYAEQVIEDVRGTPLVPKRGAHRELQDGEWWRGIPAYAGVAEEQFRDHRWQNRHAVRSAAQLLALVGDLVSPEFWADLRQGIEQATMAVRLTPYVLSLVDWSAPLHDPIRRQFIPLASEAEPDHPMTTLDALSEQHDEVAPGLVHRYPDKALFLALDVCPVYCRYCTRSYSIGADTLEVDKVCFRPRKQRWEAAFEYLGRARQVEDVVLSGGDLAMLSADGLAYILGRLLDIGHVRRVRVATKALAVMPQKVLSYSEWVGALLAASERGRKQRKQVCVHTHFNHPTEITRMSSEACDRLFQAGITIRNQSVLLRGVNDDPFIMLELVRKLGWVNVQPYYIYVHDLVPGVETLRTSLSAAIDLEKRLRGRIAGFLMPTFVCDLAGGGGKRDAHSYESYDEERGVAVFRSPVADPRKAFYHFDPLRSVGPAVREAWHREPARRQMLAASLRAAEL